MSAQDTAATEEVVDTSTNEETQDTEAELEESDVSFDDFDDADDDSEGDETEESEETDEEESANDSKKETEEESEEDETQESKANDSKAEEDKKRYNDEMAKRRIAEREAKKALKDSQDKYVSEADGPHETAVRQLQVDAYNNKVTRNNDVLQNSIDKALTHIDLFSKGSPEVKEALYEATDEFEAMYIVRDSYGNPVEVKGDLFQHLQKKADSIRRLTGIRDERAKEDRSKTKSRTVATPSRAPKKPKADPMMDGFDEEAGRW